MLPGSNSDAGGIQVLRTEIKSLSDVVGEVKSLVMSLDRRFRNNEIENAVHMATTRNDIDLNSRQIGEIDGRVISIESKMPLIQDILNLRTKIIVIVFVSGFLGTSLGALILALLFNYLFRELLL